ncbi:hypothetical protein YC2023_014740 [Brassica napus]
MMSCHKLGSPTRDTCPINTKLIVSLKGKEYEEFMGLDMVFSMRRSKKWNLWMIRATPVAYGPGIVHL